MKRRFISLVLSIAMIVALFPSINLAGATDGYKFVYDFNPSLTKDVLLSDMTIEDTRGMWLWAEGTKNLQKVDTHSASGVEANNSVDGEWFALKINVPVAGNYQATLTHSRSNSSGGYGNVYILPGDVNIADVIDSSTPIGGEIAYYSIPGKTDAITELGNITINNPGEYYLVFRSTRKGEGMKNHATYPDGYAANNRMYPHKLTLKNGEGIIPMLFDATLESDVSVGGSTKIDFTGYMSDGSGLSVSKIDSLSCTSKNPDVATVDNTGKITGVSAGETVIEISATTAGYTLTDEVTIIVENTMIPNGNTFIYDLNPDLTKDVKLSDMTIEDTRGMWLWADSTAGLKNTDTHTTSGVEATQAPIGDWFAVKINVPVAGKYQAELTHSTSRSSGGYGTVYLLPGDVDISSVIDSSKTLGGEIVYYNPDKGEVDIVTSLGSVNIETAGEYYLIFRSTRKGDGYQNHPSYENGTAANNRMYPHVFTLKNGDNAVPMLVKPSFDMNEIRINETGNIKLDAYMSDKTRISEDSEDVIVSYESLNPSVATVDEKGVVTGISAGEAEIQVSVTSNEITKSGTTRVHVSDKILKLSEYTLMYDFTYDMKKITNVVWDDITETHTRNFWMPHSVMPNLKLGTLRKTSYGLQIGTSNNQFVVLSLNIPVPGIYKTNVGVLQGVSGGQMALYILDGETEDVATALPEAQKIGVFNCYSSATTDNIYNDGNNIEFKKSGKYLLVVKSEGIGDGAGNGKNANMYLKSVKFVGTSDKIAIESLFLSKYNTELIIGEFDNVSVTEAYLSNCTVADVDDYTIEYKTSDESVAIVDDNGNITAISSGDAIISVIATRGESVAVREVEVAVLPETYSGFTSKYDLSAVDSFEDATFAKTHNLWSYNNSNTNVTINSDGVSFGKDSGSEVSLKINVPVEGDYQVRVSHKKSDNAAVGAVYVDDVKVGTVDYSSASAENKLSVIRLSAGEHLLSFKYESGDGFVQSPSVVSLYGGQKLAPVDADVVFANNTATVTNVYLSDGTEASVSDVVLRYRLESDSDSVVDIETGVVTAGEDNAEGIISAEIILNGMSFEKNINVNIIGVRESQYTLVYDFREVDISDGAPLKGVDYDKTNGFWKYHSAKVESTGIKTASYGFYLTLSKGNWAALKIFVPAPGRYAVRLDHLAGTTGGIGEIHILPADTSDVDAVINSGMSQNLGQANFFHDGSSLYPQTTLRDATFFESGEYILVFKSVEQGALGSANIYPQQIVFNPAKENPTIQNIFTKDYELCIDEDATVALDKIYLTDYSQAQIGSYNLSAVSKNPEIAVVNGNILTGVSEGETSVDITAMKDDVSITKQASVKVLPSGSSGYTFNYDFTNSIATEYKLSEYKDTYNFWKIAETDSAEFAVTSNYVKFGGLNENHVAYEINVPVSGKYRASVTHGNGEDGAVASVLVGKAIDDSVKVGTIDYTSGQITSLDELSFDKAGKYYVVFKNENNDGKVQYPASFKLVGGSKTMLVGVKINADGFGADVVGGVMSDGSVIDISDALIEFSLGNLKAGSINSKTGKITASEKGGKSSVIASVVYGDVLATGESEVVIPSKNMRFQVNQHIIALMNAVQIGCLRTEQMLMTSER